MAAPILLQYSNRAMQRLGFLKHLVARCNAAYTSHMEAVGNDLVNAARQRVAVPLTEEVRTYIRLRLQDRIYKDVRDQLAIAERAEKRGQPVSLEIQDFYLADALMPSHTGKLSPKDWDTYHRLAIALGLVRKDSYSLLVRGQTMLALCTEDELQALKNASLEPNPLLLSQGQALFFIYTVLEHDQDVLVPLLRELVNRGEGFRDWEAGDLLPGIYRGLERSFRTRANTAAERALIQSLLTYATSIEKNAGRSYAAGKGAREEHITPRLEPLVDCGVLCKPDPYFFQYQFTEAGRCLVERLLEQDNPAQFLEAGLFSAWAEAFGAGAVREGSEERILDRVIAAANKLKSSMGYAPIVDCVLLGGIGHLVEESRYFEMGDAVQLLRRLQRQAPNWLHFNIDRQGNLRYLKFAGPPPDGLELQAEAISG